ncbi:hypothetical protein Tco_0012909 [Tanacetum coccineum]
MTTKVIVKYGKPNSWTYSQFHSIADDVYTTFFEKCERKLAEPEKAEAETAEPECPRMFKKADVQECSNMKEKKDQQDVHPGTELSSYVSSYDRSSSSDESGCLEKNVHGLMKITISQKGPSKDLLNWYEDVNDHDEEEIDEKDDETDKQEDEIDEEAKDGKDDSHNELWSPKTIGTNTKNLISLKMKGSSSNSTPSTKKLVKSSEPIRNCIIGLANNKTLEMIVNKEFGVIKEDVKDQVKESKE